MPEGVRPVRGRGAGSRGAPARSVRGLSPRGGREVVLLAPLLTGSSPRRLRARSCERRPLRLLAGRRRRQRVNAATAVRRGGAGGNGSMPRRLLGGLRGRPLLDGLAAPRR